MATQLTSLRLTQRQKELITLIVGKTGLKQSELLKMAIDDYLERVSREGRVQHTITFAENSGAIAIGENAKAVKKSKH